MSIVLLSGGLDSLVLLAREVSKGRKPLCLSFDYGQRHSRELNAAQLIAQTYGVEHRIIPLPEAIFAGSALTGSGDVPHAHYADPVQHSTVVPNRNMVFLAIAGSVAVQRDQKRILFACHRGDWDIYRDCRPEFANVISGAMQLACGVEVEAPFVAMDKTEIVKLGRKLGVPFSLAWSCYKGGEEPCGQCGACMERTEAETAI